MSTQNRNLKVGNVMLNTAEFPTVKENIILKEALEKMDSFRLGIVCVVNNDDELLGIITDGDIRRLLLEKGTLDGFVSELPEKPPGPVLFIVF